jgi:hypothetical protein
MALNADSGSLHSDVSIGEVSDHEDIARYVKAQACMGWVGAMPDEAQCVRPLATVVLLPGSRCTTMPSGQITALETALRKGLCLNDLDEGCSRKDLLQAPGRLELNALGCVKHGNVPRENI